MDFAADIKTHQLEEKCFKPEELIENIESSEIAFDFIEMLTLDANEFLRTKCVCKRPGSSAQTFCKDCFDSFREAIDNNCNVSDASENKTLVIAAKKAEETLEHISCANDNDNIISSGAEMSCEPGDFNNRLLNEKKMDGEVPIKSDNGGKQNEDDEIAYNCNILKKNAEVDFNNDSDQSEIRNKVLQKEIESDFISEINKMCADLNKECSQNKLCSINYNNGAPGTNKNLATFSCSAQRCLSTIPLMRDYLKSENLIESENTPKSNLKITNCIRQDSDLFLTDKTSLANKTNPSNKNFMTELPNNKNSFDASDFPTTDTNLCQNLDPKYASHPTSVLQDLLNPPSTGPNSSETAPSRHQQESAHGESCASHTSIEANGRWREQAPRCSREFAADVGANDALERRLSQDNTTANNFLTETNPNYSSTCLKSAKIASEIGETHKTQVSCCSDGVNPRVVKEQHQHLSWGFRNGRLVFAESKSDLGDSRLESEQVVDSPESSPKAATNKRSNYYLTLDQLSEFSSNSCVKETADEKQPDGQLSSSEPLIVNENNLILRDDEDSSCVKKEATLRSGAQCQYNKNLLKLSSNSPPSIPGRCDQQIPEIEQVVDSNVNSNQCSTDGSFNTETCQDILYSKDINRRLEDSNSRIKYLEDKLKKAGLIDQNFELSESNAKVSCVDVNNLNSKRKDSSQNTCKCDELCAVQDFAADIEVNTNRNTCKSLDFKVDASNLEFCLCIDNKDDVLNGDSSDLKLDVICKCDKNEICKTNKGLASFYKSDKYSGDIPENVIPVLTNFTKNRQYQLAHSFDSANLVVNGANETLTDKTIAIPKYIEYSDFQTNDKEDTGLDSNQNVVKKEDNPEDNVEGEDLIPEDSHGLCEFDVNNFSGFSAFNVNELSGCYDEFLEDSSSSSEEACDCDDEQHFIVIRRMRGDGCTMVNEPDRNKHNPDRANLKSLLKKPGRNKDKKSNRVVFNENKNEFFDADYIILIREECDYDEDDDDGVCTCNQHEMVRLTCCEPNCNCQGYDGFEQTPQSPKFAPPMEFVDAVTLSPPEGYKDMEMMAASRGAVCRECSATHDGDVEEEGEGSQSDSEMDGQTKEQEEKEKTDQSQQTTPTTPPSSEIPNNQNYILETVTMTTVTQQQILRDAEEARRPLPASQGSPISGILKGGRLWKQQSQQSIDAGAPRSGEPNLVSSDSVTSDDETGNKRSVRFIESDEKGTRDICDGAPSSSPEEETAISHHVQKHPNIESQITSNSRQETYIGNSTSPDATEMTLTFKLGNHVLISNNSLKPNSAVRQLFPCTKTLATAQGVEEEENSQQYLVTAESLRAFEEAKRSKLPQIIQSGETDETIKRAIERNTLRRSLIRYEPRTKKQPYKTDNSLVERIKQLTCDVDYNVNSEQNQQQSSIDSSDPSEDVLDNRSSPPGEEARHSPDVNTLGPIKSQDKSFSPSSSSSSSSMSLNQNYHQLRKLSGSGEQVLMRIDNMPDIQNNFRREAKPLPDIGGPHNHDPADPPRAVANQPPDLSHCAISNKMSSSSTTSESRRQFLAPLTACVTMGVAHNEDYYYHLSNSHNLPGERLSVASSGTEYSLDDIDEGLKTEDDEHKRIAPDVLAGTPSASESGDELAMFVQQDAGRIERLKKKYQPAEQPPRDKQNNDEDDEHDDYGFNRRPSVRGIKPRFSTTTEILQQIQNQLQPPAPPQSRVAWPYYSESGLTDNSKQKNANQNVPVNYQYANVSEEAKTRGGYPSQYRPTSLQDENLYQNCANQRCLSGEIYHRPNMNTYSPVVRMGNEYYQSLPVNRPRNGRPSSPPPMDMSKQYHQTMVYIPYNHIEGYQPVQYYHTGSSDYVSRVSSQNQLNNRYVEPVYQSRVHHHVEDHHYSPTMIPPVPPKTLNRLPYPNGPPPPHMMGSRSESPLPGQFSTARATQTPAPTMSTCGYYPSNPRYRPMVGPVWQGDGNYATKVNRHSFPLAGPRYPPADSISLTDSDSQHSGSLPNGYRQSDISGYVSKDSIPNSPTKPRFIERGVPEGAASVSPQDISGVSQSSSSTMTSPTSPQNPPVPTNQKPLFYAMNV